MAPDHRPLPMRSRPEHRSRHRPLRKQAPSIFLCQRLCYPSLIHSLLPPPRHPLCGNRLYLRQRRLSGRIRSRRWIRPRRLVRQKDARVTIPHDPRYDSQLRSLRALRLLYPLEEIYAWGNHARSEDLATVPLPYPRSALSTNPRGAGAAEMDPGCQDVSRGAILWTLWADGGRRAVFGYGGPFGAEKGHTILFLHIAKFNFGFKPLDQRFPLIH